MRIPPAPATPSSPTLAGLFELNGPMQTAPPLLSLLLRLCPPSPPPPTPGPSPSPIPHSTEPGEDFPAPRPKDVVSPGSAVVTPGGLKGDEAGGLGPLHPVSLGVTPTAPRLWASGRASASTWPCLAHREAPGRAVYGPLLRGEVEGRTLSRGSSQWVDTAGIWQALLKGALLGGLGVRGPDPTPTLPLSCGPRPTGNSLLTFRSRHSMGWSF